MCWEIVRIPFVVIADHTHSWLLLVLLLSVSIFDSLCVGNRTHSLCFGWPYAFRLLWLTVRIPLVVVDRTHFSFFFLVDRTHSFSCGWSYAFLLLWLTVRIPYVVIYRTHSLCCHSWAYAFSTLCVVFEGRSCVVPRHHSLLDGKTVLWFTIRSAYSVVVLKITVILKITPLSSLSPSPTLPLSTSPFTIFHLFSPSQALELLLRLSPSLSPSKLTVDSNFLSFYLIILHPCRWYL